MKSLTIEFDKCKPADCPNIHKEIHKECFLHGSIKICPGGWADNLENNTLFARLKARCPHKAVIVTE